MGKRENATLAVFQRFVSLDSLGKVGAAETGKLTLVARAKVFGRLRNRVQILSNFRLVNPAVKEAQIPLGKGAEIRVSQSSRGRHSADLWNRLSRKAIQDMDSSGLWVKGLGNGPPHNQRIRTGGFGRLGREGALLVVGCRSLI